MSMSEIDRSFFALTDNLRFEADGLYEYEDVTPELRRLQDEFAERLAALDTISVNSEGLDTLLQFLQDRLLQSFDGLGQPKTGDTIITSGQGIAMTVNEEGMQYTETLADDVRLRGTIGRPYILEVPASVDDTDDEAVLDLPDSMAIKAAIVLEIRNATIETIDPASFYSDTEPIEPGHDVFLPIIYPNLRIKRQL